MKIVYSPRYLIDIGLHVFPTQKYRLVCERLLREGVVERSDIVVPVAASWDDLALVHTAEYLGKLRNGTMTCEDVARLELPWSQEMVEGFRLMVGGTILAARMAAGAERSTQNPQSRANQANGSRSADLDACAAARDFSPAIVCHLGGGLHHAFPNHGEGFCPFNDVAVAVRVLQRDTPIRRMAIVDLDVHHGNGTAFIFSSGGGAPPPEEGLPLEHTIPAAGDASVFTCSMHQQHNYPMWKPRSSLDVGLADGTRDPTYLAELRKALPRVMATQPELVFYLAGADPYEDDQLGGLRLTIEGLRQRDRTVIDSVTGAGVPLVIVLAGGYARHVEDTIAIHCATVEEAAGAGGAGKTGRAGGS